MSIIVRVKLDRIGSLLSKRSIFVPGNSFANKGRQAKHNSQELLVKPNKWFQI